MLVARGAHIEQGALLAAARYGRNVLFSTLIEMGAPLDDVNNEGVPDIAQAATESPAALTLFLRAKASPSQRDDYGRTVLFHAARAGANESIEILLKNDDVFLDALDHDRNTALMYLLLNPVTRDSRPLVTKTARQLIAKGIWLEVANRDGVRLAHAAAAGGDLALFESIVDKGGGRNARDGQGRTPLHYAASRQNIEVARHLIESGANVNSVSEGGDTPLHTAAGKDITELLLDRGASIDARNKAGWTPLHSAAVEADVGKGLVLLERGARKDATDADGKTPYDYVPRRFGRKESPNQFKFSELLRP
jgi:ankyrin repeat protein